MKLSAPQPAATGGFDLYAAEVLAQALDAVGAYMSFVDADLRYRWVNKRYEDWYGRPRQEIVGRALRDLMTPEQYALVEPEARRALGGERVQYEVEVPAPDGRVSVFEVSYVPAGRGQGFTVLSLDRTEERRAEQALRESEMRYGTLVQHLPGAAYRSRAGDYEAIEYVSAGVEELTGYPPGDFTGAAPARTFRGLILEEDRDRVDRETAAALEAEHPYAVEYRIRHRDGSIRWVLDKGQTYGGPAPGETRVEGVGFDITERKRAEEALRRVAEGVSAATGAEFFRSLVAHLAASLQADHVLVAALAGAANERVRTLAAVTRGTLVDNFEYELADTPCEQVITRSLCCYGAGVQRQYPADAMLRDMGAEAYIGTPLTDSEGRCLGLMAALWSHPLRDPEGAEALLRIFAARAATELERMRSEEGLRLAARVFESAAEGIMITDAEDRIVSVNRAFAEITGYAPNDLAGQHRGLLRSGLHSDAFHDEIARQVEQSGQWQGEIWNRRKDGSAFPAWMSISAVRNPQGRIASRVTIVNDISSLKESQQRLEQLANFDPLTGLPNRNLLEDRVRHGIEKARRGRQRLALLFLDLDNFKTVNDSLGHDAGDRLLARVAIRLRHSVRDQDTVARFGGDEFVILLDDLLDPQQAARMADRVAESFREP
ncbi:MAG TPA: PAS domain S-box protein, partial [Burkholderiales bacterium]|nr:PAS domain S-box protein [Burkholderiales bacterium]